MISHIAVAIQTDVGLLHWGVWQEEHNGGTQQVGGPVGVSQEWAMTYGLFLLIPLSWPQLMPLPPHATLAVLIQPCKPTYKHDENQPTPRHSKHNDHPNVNLPPSQTQSSDYN